MSDVRTINALIELFRHAVALHGGDVTNISITLLRTDDSLAEARFADDYPDAPPPMPDPAYLDPSRSSL